MLPYNHIAPSIADYLKYAGQTILMFPVSVFIAMRLQDPLLKQKNHLLNMNLVRVKIALLKRSYI